MADVELRELSTEVSGFDSLLWGREHIAPLVQRLTSIRRDMLALESTARHLLQAVWPRRKASARNLLHYVALRRHDVRALQEQLIPRGLSSLGRCEANVHATLNSVVGALCRLSDLDEPLESMPAAVDFIRARELVAQSTINLFGPRPSEGGAHIMVTMPSEAAHDPSLISELVDHGMDCMRVNCGHDDPTAWKAAIANLRSACDKLGRQCKVLMDLSGPKLRTGPIQVGTAVLKWRPQRDAKGQVIAPARIWFQSGGHEAAPSVPADAVVPVLGNWLDRVAPGDEIRLIDTRGRVRHVQITERGQHGVWGETKQTAYISADTRLVHHARRRKSQSKKGRIGAIEPTEQYLVVRRGDQLLLADEYKIGSPAQYDDHGSLLVPATIGCTLPSVFKDLKRGERVLFDDGKIAARVEQVCQHHVVLEITQAGRNGTKLRADKGINLPDSDLQLGALTDKDVQDLAFVVEHADMVGYSFVRRAEDVELLQNELTRLGRPEMPMVLKIENRQAFERLPSLLMAALRSPASGVMIARGDLAIELGWQRLAEVQEEILWMCEAAHMPVVWATQVLESLAKTGLPSRAEITDAAMGVRAECVMLNKGPHILEALQVLSGILRRMQDHQVKKRPLLRRLRLADDLTQPHTIDEDAIQPLSDAQGSK
ncbi:MAG: hypothetical protein KDA57_00865 [Planctomycetales bacterium]|nr:hypothetical protein [Planctomycetales bacterium]